MQLFHSSRSTIFLAWFFQHDLFATIYLSVCNSVITESVYKENITFLLKNAIIYRFNFKLFHRKANICRGAYTLKEYIMQ